MNRRMADAGVCLAIFALLATALAGCISIPKDYYPTSGRLLRDSTAEGGYLRKIGVGRVVNATFMTQQKLDQAFQLILVETLTSRCGPSQIVTPGDADHPGFLDDQPRLPSGVIDNYALAAAGRKEGYNAIVTAAIAGLGTRKDRVGFWRFRQTRYYLQVLVFIDVFDTASAAKLISEPVLREFEIDAGDAAIIDAGKEIVIPELNHTLDEVAEEMGTRICGVVTADPWKAFIVEQTDDGVRVSSGSRQGLSEKRQFEVFDASAILEGPEGQRYIAPGFKIGEIEILRLGPQESVARILSGGPFAEGSILRPKP